MRSSLLRISEAARVLGDDADRFAGAVNWRDVRGIGNRLRHEYRKIDVGLIWRIVDKDLAPLEAAVDQAIHVLRTSPPSPRK